MSAFLVAGDGPKRLPPLRENETRQKARPRGQTRGECEDSEAHFATRAVWHLTKPQLRGGANATPFFPAPISPCIHPQFVDEREVFVAFRCGHLSDGQGVRSRRSHDDDVSQHSHCVTGTATAKAFRVAGFALPDRFYRLETGRATHILRHRATTPAHDRSRNANHGTNPYARLVPPVTQRISCDTQRAHGQKELAPMATHTSIEKPRLSGDNRGQGATIYACL